MYSAKVGKYAKSSSVAGQVVSLYGLTFGYEKTIHVTGFAHAID